ncbi:MAG: hypothetical protein U0798_15140 [Gemmataceae bacterium]
MAKEKNLRILAANIGVYRQGDIVPAYALIKAKPDSLVKKGLAEWTGDRETVQVSATELTKAAPDASHDLIKAHATLKREHESALRTIETLHGKCLDLEKKHEAVSKSLVEKTEELEEARARRDAIAVEVQELKTLIDAQTTPDGEKTDPKSDAKNTAK